MCQFNYIMCYIISYFYLFFIYTLLKNENVLPLSKSEKVLVTGPAANSLNIINCFRTKLF